MSPPPNPLKLPKARKIPLMLPRAHLQAIGNLAAHWAYVENVVEFAIWAELNLTRRQGMALTTHMGLVSRCQLIVMLIHERLSETLCKPMEDLLARIDKTRVQRNDIIHAFWKREKTGTSAEVMKTTAKGRIRQERRAISVNEIRDVTYEAWQLASEMMDLLEEMYPEQLFAWRKRLRGSDHH